MKKLIFVGFILFSTIGLYSQNVPGYMGKKISLGGSGQILTSLQGVISGNIAFGPAFSASYTVGRNSELGLSFESYSAKTEFTEYPIVDYYQSIVDVKIKFQSLSLTYSLFKNKGLAPLGPYYIFGLGKIWSAPAHNVSKNVRASEYSGRIKEYNYMVYSTGIFRKDILIGPVFINYGILLNLTTGFKYGGSLNPFSERYGDQHFDDPANANAIVIHNQLKKTNFLVVRLGLGILI